MSTFYYKINNLIQIYNYEGVVFCYGQQYDALNR